MPKSPAVTLKIIRPDEFKVDEIRMQALNALRKEGTAMKKRLDGTTATWKGAKPKFEKKVGLTRVDGEAGVTVTATEPEKGVQKWTWLNKGTRAHFVPKSGVATMAFHPSYKAKTRPRKLSSGGGGPRGSRIVRRGRWKVSGIEAREWDEALAEEREGPFKDAMQKAIKKGAQKAGMR